MRVSSLVASVAAIAALAVANPSAAAAVKKRPPAGRKAPAKKPSPVEYLSAALVVNSQGEGEPLSAVCDRAGFKGLAWSLDGVKDWIVPVKGEFETSADFAVRQDKVLSALNSRPVVVCLPFDDYDMIATYDADAAVFTVVFKDNLRVDLDYKKTGSYVSRTRMGVRATVTSFLDITYEADMSDRIAPLAQACLDKGGYSFERRFRFAVDRARAPGVKAGGRVALVGRIVQPIYSYDESTGRPTLDDPTYTFSATLSVKFAPTALVVLDAAGNEIHRCAIG